ncbi:MAG TPA: MBL fold metallo-hydrolase [Candidatus Limnocylindria bacterium]|nr:MBL fold metallo-hydrolase [Candidatus Limnocylindria bacterium]
MTSSWHEVGDRVFVRRYSDWHGEPFDQNAGVVLGADGALVIDTRASHRLADVLIAEVRELTSLPIAAVVNTHHHWDHSWGNARFLPAPIWGHVRCGPRMLERSPRILERILADEPGLAEELQEVVVTPPTRTIDESGTIDLGDRQVELRYLGRGHTDNDIVVIVPDARVLFAGDLLENNASPSFGDAYPIAWADTVARLLPLAGDAVVPGHGSVGGRPFAERQAGEFALIAQLGRDVVSGAIGEDEATSRSPFPADVTAIAVERARLELAEEPIGRHA